MTCVYYRVEGKLFVCFKTKTPSFYSRKEINTLHLRLNTYDFTSNF